MTRDIVREIEELQERQQIIEEAFPDWYMGTVLVMAKEWERVKDMKEGLKEEWEECVKGGFDFWYGGRGKGE